MTYKKLHYSFWISKAFCNLTASERWLLSYLYTNPHAHFSGLYYINIGAVSEETALDIECIEASLARLQEKGLIRIERHPTIVWVINMLRLEGKQSETQRTAINNQLVSLKESALVPQFLKYYCDLCLDSPYKQSPNNGKGSFNSDPHIAEGPDNPSEHSKIQSNGVSSLKNESNKTLDTPSMGYPARKRGRPRKNVNIKQIDELSIDEKITQKKANLQDEPVSKDPLPKIDGLEMVTMEENTEANNTTPPPTPAKNNDYRLNELILKLPSQSGSINPDYNIPRDLEKEFQLTTECLPIVRSWVLDNEALTSDLLSELREKTASSPPLSLSIQFAIAFVAARTFKHGFTDFNAGDWLTVVRGGYLLRDIEPYMAIETGLEKENAHPLCLFDGYLMRNSHRIDLHPVRPWPQKDYADKLDYLSGEFNEDWIKYIGLGTDRKKSDPILKFPHGSPAACGGADFLRELKDAAEEQFHSSRAFYWAFGTWDNRILPTKW